MSRDRAVAIGPALAARLAADTGRTLSDVARELDELDHTSPDKVDAARVVALLAPTAVALGRPELPEILARAERAPAEMRGPALGRLARALAPAIAQAVTAQETLHARP